MLNTSSETGCAHAPDAPRPDSFSADHFGFPAGRGNIGSGTIALVMVKRLIALLLFASCLFALINRAPAQTTATPKVLHAARLLDIETGRITSPGEVLVRGERIVEVGSAVSHPAGAQI